MQRREKLFWLAVGAAFVVGFMALIPAHGEICKEGAKTGEEACTTYSLVPFIVIKMGKILDALGVAITALATIAIAWFTLSLWRSTDKLWDAGERQIQLARETSAAQSRDMQASILAAQRSADAAMMAIGTERAWIAAVQPNITTAKDSLLNEVPFRTAFGFSVIWKNSGRSPAIKAQAAIFFEIGGWLNESPIPHFTQRQIGTRMAAR